MTNIIELIKNSIIKDTKHPAIILFEDKLRIEIELSIPWPRDEIIKYFLSIEKEDNLNLKVREIIGKEKLPKFCPQRHINFGGYFCLGVSSLDDLTVKNETSADRWYKRLITYLNLQEKAIVLKQWDYDKEWAHGAAAEYQQLALDSAKNLGSFFIQAINSRIINVKVSQINKRDFLTITFKNHDLEYRVNTTTKKVTRLKSLCFCDSKNKKRIGRCSSHSHDLYVFGLAYVLMDFKEDEFWDGWIKKGTKCCGFCKSCKLDK